MGCRPSVLRLLSLHRSRSQHCRRRRRRPGTTSNSCTTTSSTGRSSNPTKRSSTSNNPPRRTGSTDRGRSENSSKRGCLRTFSRCFFAALAPAWPANRRKSRKASVSGGRFLPAVVVARACEQRYRTDSRSDAMRINRTEPLRLEKHHLKAGSQPASQTSKAALSHGRSLAS